MTEYNEKKEVNHDESDSDAYLNKRKQLESDFSDLDELDMDELQEMQEAIDKVKRGEALSQEELVSLPASLKNQKILIELNLKHNLLTNFIKKLEKIEDMELNSLKDFNERLIVAKEIIRNWKRLKKKISPTKTRILKDAVKKIDKRIKKVLKNRRKKKKLRKSENE